MKIFGLLSTLILAYLISQSSFVAAIFDKENSVKIDQFSQQALIERQFSQSNGAHIELEKLIKQYLPNPQSYQHIHSHYEKNQDQLTVFTQYSSIRENGERIKADAMVVYHLNGRLINLLKVD